MILVEKTEPSMLTPTDSSLDALSSDRGKVFSAMVRLRLAVRSRQRSLSMTRLPMAATQLERISLKDWIEALNPPLNSLIRLDSHLPYLSYTLMKQWVHLAT